MLHPRIPSEQRKRAHPGARLRLFYCIDTCCPMEESSTSFDIQPPPQPCISDVPPSQLHGDSAQSQCDCHKMAIHESDKELQRHWNEQMKDYDHSKGYKSVVVLVLDWEDSDLDTAEEVWRTGYCPVKLLTFPGFKASVCPRSKVPFQSRTQNIGKGSASHLSSHDNFRAILSNA